MSPLSILRIARRVRCHPAALVAVVAVGVAIAAHHSALGQHDTHHEPSVVAAIELCLGIVALGASVIAVALGSLPLGRWRPPSRLAAGRFVWLASPPSPRSRAGPALLTLLCVSRR